VSPGWEWAMHSRFFKFTAGDAIRLRVVFLLEFLLYDTHIGFVSPLFIASIGSWILFFYGSNSEESLVIVFRLLLAWSYFYHKLFLIQFWGLLTRCFILTILLRCLYREGLSLAILYRILINANCSASFFTSTVETKFNLGYVYTIPHRLLIRLLRLCVVVIGAATPMLHLGHLTAENERVVR
jgi:hypothetical protein